MEGNNNAFNKGTPSVFAVSSPFQVLCAVAAIRQFGINDFIVVLRLPIGGLRNSQMENLLKYYSIPYKSIRTFNSSKALYLFNRLINKFFLFRGSLHKNNRYKRLFIGDYRDAFNCYVGCGLVSDNSDIVYLDDGNITISQLQGRDTEPLDSELIRFQEKNRLKRGFLFSKNILTIYNDIPNPHYSISGLQFDLLNTKKCENIEQKDVFIVGTNLERYCGPLELAETSFIEYLDKLMKQLKSLYKDDQVVYIPHGREYLTYAQELCERNGCVFRRPSTLVEIELLTYTNPPRAIYGFTSTALHTLKKLFPSSKVVNILFEGNRDNPFYIDYVNCSEYYLKSGIECEMVKM